MIQGLEHMSYEEKLRELKCVQLQKQKVKEKSLMEELEKAFRLPEPI